MPTPQQKQLTVFISHAHADVERARELADRLRRDGFDTFLDVEHIAPGENWSLAIGQALERAGAIVLLLSKDWSKSENSKRELDFALGSRRLEGRVVPVVVPGTPERSLRSLPWILERLHTVTGKEWHGVVDATVNALRRLARTA
jgi:hypothetical protein